jgi:hypothetical protein
MYSIYNMDFYIWYWPIVYVRIVGQLKQPAPRQDAGGGGGGRPSRI